ncbi:MAG TPA: alkaline phosphatase family protein [Candidatus Angelobacter sp.]|nr:alkaline phosphatase family protein [Candidatus Angelobacter sp.]
MRKTFLLLLLSFASAWLSQAANSEKHVVLVVWDGMRPDFVTPTNTPTLYALSRRGVFFAHNHAVYVSSTEVNGAALATGAYPEHSGIIGNREFRPEIDPKGPFGTDSLAAMRKADELGGYLHVPTVAETLQQQGYSTAIAGCKPVALLHDRTERPESAANIVLFQGQTLPAGAIAALTNVLGPFYDHGNSKTNRDMWTARALTEQIWKHGVPSFSLLWLGEPDSTQHGTGVGSPQSLAAMRNSDTALAHVIAKLKEKGAYDTTDIFVVSDHGFSTVVRKVDMVANLRQAGFNAARLFKQPPARGDVLFVGLGGSALIYVIGHDGGTIDHLVKFLQTEDSVGPIFTGKARAGTFALDDAMIHSSEAPDIAISFGWTSNKNLYGASGSLISEAQGSNLTPVKQEATHASLSPFDLHNTLVAAGPDLRQGFVDSIPTGNVDVAPTILKILGVKPAKPMDGRVLVEALKDGSKSSPSVRTKTLRAHATLPTGKWTQTLQISEVNGTRYLDQGTGQFTPEASR